MATGQVLFLRASIYRAKGDLKRSAQMLSGSSHSCAACALTLSRQDTQPGTFSSQLGQAYLTLGRALQAQGKQGEARAAFSSAAQSLESTLGAGSPDVYRARQLAGMDSQSK
jgi:hypothetical protein